MGDSDVVTPIGWNRAIRTSCVNRSWALWVRHVVAALGRNWARRGIVGGNAVGGGWVGEVDIALCRDRARRNGDSAITTLIGSRALGRSCVGSLVSRNRSIGHWNRSAGDRLVRSIMCLDVIVGDSGVVIPVGRNRAIRTGRANRSWALGVGRIVVALGGDWAGRAIVGGNPVRDHRMREWARGGWMDVIVLKISKTAHLVEGGH